MARNRVAVWIAVFVVVFGGLAALVIQWISRDAAQEPSPSAPTTENTIADRDGLSLLVITVDEGDAQGFVLVRVDPANSRLRTLALPRETAADADGKRLFEVYAAQNGAGCVEAVRALTAFAVDHYVVLTYDDIEELLNRGNADLPFTLPENLRYEMADYTIHLDGGEQRLSPTQVTDVLRYPAWNDGRSARSAIQADILTACINEYFTPALLEDDQGYNALVEVADTDWLREDYTAMRETLQAVAQKNSGEICATLSLTGSYTGDGDAVRFLIDTPLGTTLRSVFGGNDQ